MSRVEESIVREYFEQNGFLVRQLQKQQVRSRKKGSEEEVDLLVLNPAYRPGGRKADFFLFPSEWSLVDRAIVSMRGWQTWRFGPAMLRSSAQIFRFLEQNVVKRTGELWTVADEEGAVEGAARVLVVPGLPTAEPYRSQAAAMLRAKGVEGIVSFRAILTDVVGRVEIDRNYERADVLEAMRVLKNYDLVKDAQMELFGPEAR
jgi:hypothetical protein